jgi:catechol 2,3-dioxygenase-like lactoylglutathione lyase family enzyme
MLKLPRARVSEAGVTPMNELVNSKPKFEGISPVFPVTDMPSALSFYCDILGFDIGWTWGDPPTHANVCRGQIDISLTLDPSKAGSGEAYVGLTAVDAYFAELQSRKTVLGELADRTYGMRDFSVEDPSGNRLVFGQPIIG